MTNPSFGNEVKVTVNAGGATLWTLALPYVAGPIKLRITADRASKWKRGDTECGPGGSFEGTPDMLLPTSPRGALIAKIGGSDSDCPQFTTEGAAPVAATSLKLVGVGSCCVIDVKASDSGPLFLTMNDSVAGFKTHYGAIEASITFAVT